MSLYRIQVDVMGVHVIVFEVSNPVVCKSAPPNFQI